MKEDYARNLVELETRFSTEEICREYLLKLRWPEEFVCLRCETQSAWASKRNLLLCADYGYRVAPRIVRIYTLSLSASHETAVELVLAVEEDVVPPDRADMGQ